MFPDDTKLNSFFEGQEDLFETFRKVVVAARSATEWGTVIASYWISKLVLPLIPGGWAKDNFIELFTVTVGLLFIAYFKRAMRFRVNRWGGRMIVCGNPSGRPPHYEYILRRTRPRFLLFPISHCVGAWTFTIGKLSPGTGGVNITEKTTVYMKNTDECRWELGGYGAEKLEDEARALFVRYYEHLGDKVVGAMTQGEKDKLETMKAAITCGLDTGCTPYENFSPTSS